MENRQQRLCLDIAGVYGIKANDFGKYQWRDGRVVDCGGLENR